MRILLTGGGQGAALIAARLIGEGHQVTIVEKDAARCVELEEHLDAKIVNGSGGSVRTLKKAGIGSAEMFIAETDSDEVNLLGCMIAEARSNVRFKVARVRTHEFRHWDAVLQDLGLKVDKIIHPETTIMDRIMRVLHLPGVSDILDFADGKIKLFGMNVDADSWYAGKTVEELDAAGPPKNSMISMIFRGPEVIIPHGAQKLMAGDHLYICTTSDDIDDVLEFMGIQQKRTLRRVVVVGGKQLGIWVAQELERRGIHVKLIERDAARCQLISRILARTVVVQGDPTDQQTLEEENIRGADAFLALTKDDAANVVASLLARRLGAHKIVALINRTNYLPIVQRLGINTAISQRLTAVDMILGFVRKSHLLSVTTFREEEAEALEFIASPGSRIVNRKLREIRMPRGAVVGAIVRDNGYVRVPRGEATVREGDRVIIFSLADTVQQIESQFLAKTGRRRLFG